MGYAVGHITKMGSGGGGIGSHIDRTQKNSPKNVDPERTQLNKDFVATGGTMLQDVNRRIKDGYKSVNKDGTARAIRPDAVKAVGFILSGSNKEMLELQKQGRLDEWAKANLEFCKQQYGEKNIVRFTMHLDEKTPHIHCVFVPLDKEGNLTAKTIVGNKEKLSQLQTDYAAAMKPFGLERGIKNSRVSHTTTREYYAGIEHTREEAAIEKNVIGQPKSGEEERIQEVVSHQQMEIIRLNTDTQRNNAKIEEEKKKLAEAKAELLKEQKLLGEQIQRSEKIAAQLQSKEAQLDEKEKNMYDITQKAVAEKTEPLYYRLDEALEKLDNVTQKLDLEKASRNRLLKEQEEKITKYAADRILEVTKEQKAIAQKEGFKLQVDLMHLVNTRLFDFGSKLQVANLDTLKGKKDFEGFKLEFKEYPKLLEIHQYNNRRNQQSQGLGF